MRQDAAGENCESELPVTDEWANLSNGNG